MFNTIKAKNEAIDTLKGYNGKNPYILRLKRDVIIGGDMSLLRDFNVEYILTNYNTDPVQINKVVGITDWYGQKLKDEHGIEFIPSKLLIIHYMGQTKTTYHCVVKYRQNMEPLHVFLPKSAVMDDFLSPDYNDIEVDFDRYDRLSSSKDPNRLLKEHQKSAAKFLLSRKKCILADTMGLGKSNSLIVSAIEGNFDSILIICPASIKAEWKKELMWYVPEKDITVIESVTDKNKKELEAFLGYSEGKSGLSLSELKDEAKNIGKWSDNRFVIINYDILGEFYKFPKSRSKENIEKAFNESPLLQYVSNKKSLIIVDEAHRLSNSKSDRYKIINDLIKKGNPDSVYLSTGTPLTNNPQNLYCLLKLIGEPVADDYNYYMNRFCGAKKIPAKGEKAKWTGYFMKMVKKNEWSELTSEEKTRLKDYVWSHARMITLNNDATNLDELRRKIAHIYLRREKEDLSDGLPMKHVHEVIYDFNEQQWSEYSKLWEEYEAAQLELDPEKEINKELLEGAVYRKYCSIQMLPNTIRLAEKLISEGEKVIIATSYDEELYSLQEHFGDKCVIFNGKLNAKQKEQAKKEFINNPDVMVFIGNIQASSLGLTLINSHIVIFNTFSYADIDNKQMEDRVYRIGQKHECDIYYQMFRNTRVEEIWNICLRKYRIFSNVIKKENEKNRK